MRSEFDSQHVLSGSSYDEGYDDVKLCIYFVFCFNFCFFYTLDYLGYAAGCGGDCGSEKATDVCLISFFLTTYP